jgi:L-threonylcarbamoyladenylate synthase
MLIFNDVNDPKLIELLNSGAVGVIPSDTVYGLMCRADNSEAVEKLYQVKPRELKPGTLIAANIDQLVELGIPRRYLKAVEHFWPNPISIVIPTTPELKYLDHGLMSLPMRIPADEKLRKFLEKTGPLQTTSANLPDEPPAKNIAEAIKYFGEMVDFYVDTGKLPGGPPSTIIRVIDDAVEIIREGAVKINEKGEIE